MNGYLTNQTSQYPLNTHFGNSNVFKRPHDFNHNWQQQEVNWKKARIDGDNSSFMQRFDNNNIVSQSQQNRVDYRYIENKNVHNHYRIIENGIGGSVIQQNLSPPPPLMQSQQSSIETRPFMYAKQ